ncbi:MAG: hypothetical protein FJW96_01425, partial [Actinobacteria bacterium]|nr:hypothetical protein [Actinomycetota bacterium]
MGDVGVDIEALVAAGDADACIATLLAVDAETRRPLASIALRLLEAVEQEWLSTFGGQDRDSLRRRRGVASAAALCCGERGDLRRRRVWLGGEHAARILVARRPPWLQDFVEEQFPPGQRGPFEWLDPLAAAGAITITPALAAAIPGALFWFVRDEHTVAGTIRDRPWLRDAVWLLFEVEGGGESSLAAADKYSGPAGNWQSALVELAADGTLDRRRLLDASLDALDRGFAEFRAGWFLRFHQALAPTLEERASRADRYLRLLASPQGPTQSFALNAVEALEKAGCVDSAELVGGLRHLVA